MTEIAVPIVREQPRVRGIEPNARLRGVAAVGANRIVVAGNTRGSANGSAVVSYFRVRHFSASAVVYGLFGDKIRDPQIKIVDVVSDVSRKMGVLIISLANQRTPIAIGAEAKLPFLGDIAPAVIATVGLVGIVVVRFSSRSKTPL